ncbi:MAG: molybdopterin dinucleotide binding domain-containing protein [Paracoccaceae bacterium]
MASDVVMLSDPSPNQIFLSDFRTDPDANPLPTPSGRIEIFSEMLASFDLEDCLGHTVWSPPRDLDAGEGDFYLLFDQPKTRLHGHLDNGACSLGQKIKGREPVLIHPGHAAPLGIHDGDVVELFNSRGRCLFGARVTDEVRQGCVFLWTGAWWDPDFDAQQMRDRHGNPKALTHDQRTSSLSQSPAAHSARVSVRKFEGQPPEVAVHRPPALFNGVDGKA